MEEFNIVEMDLLFDAYSPLLTDRQRDILELYFGENLSLSEIAEQFGISRTAVHDAIAKGGRKLKGFEEKLGLAGRCLEIENACDALDAAIEQAGDTADLGAGLEAKLREQVERIRTANAGAGSD